MCLCVNSSEFVDSPSKSVNKVYVGGETNLHISNQTQTSLLQKFFAGHFQKCGKRTEDAIESSLSQQQLGINYIGSNTCGIDSLSWCHCTRVTKTKVSLDILEVFTSTRFWECIIHWDEIRFSIF